MLELADNASNLPDVEGTGSFWTAPCCLFKPRKATEEIFWISGVALASRERKKLILVQSREKKKHAAVESRAGNGSVAFYPRLRSSH